MPITVPPIPTPVPQSTDPLNFDARADSVLSALPGVVTAQNQQNNENNTINTNVNAQRLAAGVSESAANTSALAAASSANFRGAWSALTGALNVPASVLHNGRIWQLLTNQPNVATAVPGVSAAWYPVVGVDVASRAPIAPTLDLDFARQRYSMYNSAAGGLISVTLASILTYTGANRTFVDAQGVLRVQASNVPRLTFDPVTGVGNGLNVFEARTNLFLNSLVNGTSLATQSVTLGAGDHRLSFFGTGTVAITGTASGTLVGAGAYPSRSGLAFTATAGSVTFTVSGTVQFANLTTGTSDSPYIPTTTAAVTAPDDLASLTGTNFSKWFNPVEGTFVVVSNALMNAPTARHIFVSNEALTSFFTITNGAVTPAQRRFDAVDAGVAQAQLVYGEAVGPGLRSFAASYKANDFAASMSGGALLTDTLGTVPVVDHMGIGCNSLVNAEHLNGTISRILYFPRALPANLQQLSA